jgi:GWxTD domain-containing protein
MKLLNKIFGYTIMVCLSITQGYFQVFSYPNQFIFNTTYNRYWQTDSTAYLEIETAFNPYRIALIKDSSAYKGKVEFKVLIQKKVDSTYVHADRYFVPVIVDDTSSAFLSKLIVNKMTFVLARGSYKIMIYGMDTRFHERGDSAIFLVDINRRPAGICVSDVELCSNISESTDRKDEFYKNTYRVIPHPSMVFGSVGYPVVFSYVELYNLTVGMTYVVNAQVIDAKGTIVKYRSHNRQCSISNTVDVTTLNISKIASGKYRYRVAVSDTLGKEIAWAERPIYLYNPDIQNQNTSSISARSAEFAGMSADELADEFKKAQYLLRSEDKKLFEKLTAVGEQREFLAKMWSDIETGKRGRNDMNRSIYLQRVQKANQLYGSMNRAGWKTDRGRIFILYDNPDEIERYPSSNESNPYEIWQYYQIEGGIKFVFIDRSDNGIYTLVHSTKRGEIQDENWEQFLR